MSKFIDIISPIYQNLLTKCSRKKISVNLDIQDLTAKVTDDEQLASFFTNELKRALKNSEAGDKITIAQSTTAAETRYSVKSSAKKPLDAETVAKLRESGLEVRSRFGYDTIVTLKLA